MENIVIPMHPEIGCIGICHSYASDALPISGCIGIEIEEGGTQHCVQGRQIGGGIRRSRGDSAWGWS